MPEIVGNSGIMRRHLLYLYDLPSFSTVINIFL